MARRLLARPFALEGVIGHGAGVGAKFQVPTANLQAFNELIPRRGIYVTLFNVDGCRYKSVTNIGVRPTMNQSENAPLSIETHIFDFNQDVYGKKASLDFLVRLRDERRFSDVNALIGQIHRDIANARRYFHWVDRVIS